jgi:penicillin-binding protein 2
MQSLADNKDLNVAKWRQNLVVLFAILVALIFFIRLMTMQIVEGESYRSYLTEGYSVTKTIEAARGDIVDRYGRSLAENRVRYDITFDKNNIVKDSENSVILELVTILEENGEEWIDNLPLSKTAPFEYEGTEKARTKLRKHLGLAEFASPEDVVFRLKEKYGLEEMSDEDFRKIAGVRYEMDRVGYNYVTPYTFATDVSNVTINIISEHSYYFQGIEITENYERKYPNGDVAPHIIGITGIIYEEEYANLDKSVYGMNDIIGKSGLESAFESVLKGKDGKMKITYDAEGEIISEEIIEEAVPGATVVSTLDMDLQRVTYNALEKQILNLRNTAQPGMGKESEGGVAVVIKVGTGEILAAANYPSYNLSTYYEDYSSLLETEYNPLFNRATEGTYAPGSTFKPVVATAALQLGNIKSNSTVNCEHVYTYFTDYQPTCLGHHGRINVRHALGYSCNIFFYEIGRIMGIDNIRQYAYYYGLGEPTGVEIKERIGQVSNPDWASNKGISWFKGDVLQASIGQGYSLFSPVQMANYVATLANKGVRVNAHFVKSINSHDFSEVLYETPVEVLSDMGMTDYTYETVLSGMLQSSQDSSGFVWGDFDIKVASKTGTPQTTTKTVNSTFICFAPAEDPEIAIAVIIEKGWQGYTAAPVAKEILQYYFGTESGNSHESGVLVP